ncbi:hypothetical protein E4U53_004799, partial [Claviceps sorghi]
MPASPAPPQRLCCPSCGSVAAPPGMSMIPSDTAPDPLRRAQARIAQLEAEVARLNAAAAAAAASRWADHDAELHEPRS